MSFYIKLLFDQPCVDLGIVFDDFAIADDAISADENNELLSVIENLSDRRAFYAEINIEEDEQHPWYDIEIDDRYLARFIPLLKVDDQTTLFHAPHLYQLLDYLFSIEGVAPFFAVPRGPSCLIPRFDGAILSLEWKGSVWDRYVMGAPRPRTPSEQQYSDRKLRSRR